MKLFATIFLILGLLLSPAAGFASPAQQLCAAATACGCGDGGCCMAAADPVPVPAVPASLPETTRGPVLAALPLTPQLPQLRPPIVPKSDFFPAFSALADVPLFVRHCSYLI